MQPTVNCCGFNHIHIYVLLHNLIDFSCLCLQVSELTAKNTELTNEIAAKCEAFEEKIKDLENKLSQEVDSGGKLQKEKDNLIGQVNDQKESFENRIAELNDQVDSLKQNLSELLGSSEKIILVGFILIH